jgi:hypothetical protein
MPKIVIGGETRKVFKATGELIKEAKEKGVCPCDICKQVPDTEKCNSPSCYAWYVWFSEKWQNIKEAARRKGYNV